MKEIVIATENRGKLREIEASLQGMEIQIVSPKDLLPLPPIEEDGKTFQENALKKARIVSQHTGQLTIADDSGLEVDRLGGEPGIRSARFAGEGASDADNNRTLLHLLKGIPLPERGARFRCVIAVVDPGGKESWVEGECRGIIGETEQGEHGFGYDPLFFLPEFGKTLAELPLEMKNRVSHRGKALAALKQIIKDFI